MNEYNRSMQSWTKNNKLVDLWLKFKNDNKWRTLDFGQKIYLLMSLAKAFDKCEEMGVENLVDNITPELILNHISERGYNRDRRILDFVDQVNKEYIEFKWGGSNPQARKGLRDLFKPE